MAWYALYKWFIPWRKIPYTNWIKWYRKHLYSEWFKSLTDVEQKTELERQQKIREENIIQKLHLQNSDGYILL